MRKIILDTDPALGVKLGVDIDDDLAIMFLLASPEIEIIGLTTTYGNSTSGRTFHDLRRETDASRFIRDILALTLATAALTIFLIFS